MKVLVYRKHGKTRKELVPLKCECLVESGCLKVLSRSWPSAVASLSSQLLYLSLTEHEQNVCLGSLLTLTWRALIRLLQT